MAMAIVAVVVLAVIVYGAVADRRRNRREAEQLVAPPEREIPKFVPERQTPHYLTELEARRTATTRTLDDTERARFTKAKESATRIAVGYASAAFVTDQATDSVALADVRVLVCGEGLTLLREVIGPVEESLSSPHPLVIVAPDFADEVLHTLEVNSLQGLADVLLVRAEGSTLDRIVEATGATTVDLLDLRTGYVPSEVYGTADTWLSTPKETWIG